MSIYQDRVRIRRALTTQSSTGVRKEDWENATVIADGEPCWMGRTSAEYAGTEAGTQNRADYHAQFPRVDLDILPGDEFQWNGLALRVLSVFKPRNVRTMVDLTLHYE